MKKKQAKSLLSQLTQRLAEDPEAQDLIEKLMGKVNDLEDKETPRTGDLELPAEVSADSD